MPTGTSRMARAKRGDQVEAIADSDPGAERALRRGLDHRPVGDRVGEGDADLDHVGAALDDARRAAPRWSPGRDRRASGRRRTRPRRARQPLEHGARSGSCDSSACACATSLSPRPDRPTRIALSGSRLGELQRMRERVGGFERADDALALGQRLEGGERLGVGRADIFGAAAVLQMRMLGPDRGIIEPGRDRPGVGDLPVRRPAGRRSRRRGGCRACRAAGSRHARSPSSPLPAASTPISRTSSSRKSANRPIAFEPPPTQATTASGRRPSCSRICARASRPITRWNSRTIGRERMRPGRRAEQIMGGLEARRPVAQRLVDRILQRPPAAFDRHDLAPISCIRKTLSCCRSTSSAPM